ncbi:MAG: glycosyltransferase family 2 protein [Rhodoplanes sp.]
MAASDRVVVVIAAYNEAPVIASVVADVRRASYPAVVVDDGSTDATGEIAAFAGAFVVTHPVNLGQGAALQTALDFALAQGADVIVTFDADGQHRPADIAPLIAALAANKADYALGSRFLGGAVNLPRKRRVMLAAATWFTRLTTGLDLTDTHNGLRAMTRRGASRIRLKQNRMAHASEILHQIAQGGLAYVEVPVTIEYSAYSLGKGQTLSESLAILIDLFARRMHR